MARIAALIIVILTTLSAHGHGGQRAGFLVRNYTVSNEIGGNLIAASARTADGYAWIGTMTGLFRFNGHRHTPLGKLFTVPRHNANVLLAHDDQLIMGTSGQGLWFISSDGVQILNRADGLSDDVLWDLLPDGHGGLWAATSQGVDYISDAGMRSPQALRGLATGLALDSLQRLWVVFNDGSLRVLDGDVAQDRTLPGERSISIAVGDNGELWLGTDTGLRKGHAESSGFSDPLPEFADDPVVQLNASGDRVWAATESGQLYEYMAQRWHHRHLSHRLPDTRITDLYRDDQGQLWVGTRSGLALVIGDNSIVSLGPDFSGPDVWAVISDTEGRVWMASDGGGINEVDVENVRLKQLGIDLPSDEIWSLAASPNGGFWVGTGNVGAFLVRDGAVAEVIDDLPVSQVWTLLESSRSGLWIGTDGGGLVHINNGVRKVYGRTEGLPGDRIWSLYESSEGQLWVGTNLGLCRKDGDSWVCLDSDNEFARGIWAINPAANGGIWISTTRGLALVDGQANLWPVTREPLASVSIYGVQTDAAGNLWALSERGLHLVGAEHLGKLTDPSAGTVPIRTFGAAEGLTHTLDSGASPPMLQDRLGGLWLASNNGLVLVQPQNLETAPTRVPLVIERLEVDGQEVSALQASVEPGPRHVRIEYAALAYGREHLTRLQTRLIGVSQRWSEPALEFSAGYSGLGPGNYRFEVRLAPNDIGLVGDVAALEFQVLPFWHEQLWVRLAAAMLLLLMLAGIMRARTSATRKQYQARTAQMQEKMDAALALEASERRFRDIYDNVSDLVMNLDVEGRILALNPAAQALFPAARIGDLLGAHLPGLPPAGDLQSGSGLEMELASADSANPRILELTVARGGDQAILITGRDVTEQRGLQQKVAASERLEAIGKLTAGVAHDFNNLLTVIQGNAALLQEDLDRSEDRTLARSITDAADRAADLTRKLLSIGRRTMMNLKFINLNDHLSQMGDLLHRVIEENIRIRMRLNGNPVVKMDSALLEQIVINLVVNARDAIRGQGEIELSTQPVALDRAFLDSHPGASVGPHVLLTVSDSGDGMTPDVVQRAFEPFFTTKGPATGSGLGLSTVYGAVKQSGGSIFIESNPGHGTRVKVYLPTVSADPSPPPPDPQDSGGACGEHILLVDDDPQIVDITARLLAGAGYHVSTASGVEEGMAFAMENPPDLVITDIVMADGSGLDLAKQLGEAGLTMPVLYISGYSDEHLELAPDEAKAFLAKPFTRHQIIEQVHRLLAVGTV